MVHDRQNDNRRATRGPGLRLRGRWMSLVGCGPDCRVSSGCRGHDGAGVDVHVRDEDQLLVGLVLQWGCRRSQRRQLPHRDAHRIEERAGQRRSDEPRSQIVHRDARV